MTNKALEYLYAQLKGFKISRELIIRNYGSKLEIEKHDEKIAIIEYLIELTLKAL